MPLRTNFHIFITCILAERGEGGRGYGQTKRTSIVLCRLSIVCRNIPCRTDIGSNRPTPFASSSLGMADTRRVAPRGRSETRGGGGGQLPLRRSSRLRKEAPKNAGIPSRRKSQKGQKGKPQKRVASVSPGGAKKGKTSEPLGEESSEPESSRSLPYSQQGEG